MKRLLSCLLALVMIAGLGFFAGAEQLDQADVAVVIDGVRISMPGPADIQDGHTLAPLRAVVEKLGWDVVWDKPRVRVARGGDTMVFTVGETEVVYNGQTLQCPRAPEIRQGVVYVPVRFLCETMGMDVDFKAYPALKIVFISQKGTTVLTQSGDPRCFPFALASCEAGDELTVTLRYGMINDVTLEPPGGAGDLEVLDANREFVTRVQMSARLDENRGTVVYYDWDYTTQDGTRLAPGRYTVGLTSPAVAGIQDEPVWFDIQVPERSFAFSLMKRMPEDGNYMISPVSVKLALAMAAGGAEGETRRQMLDVLQIEDLDAFNQQARDVIDTLNRAEDETYQVANSIWINTDQAGGARFDDEFSGTIEQMYFGQAGEVTDETAVDTINGWISDQTNGLIQNTIDSCDFVAALVNTIYFKGEFFEPFDPEDTYQQDFTDADGNVQQIDFMHQTGDFRYYEDETMQMLELPYKGDSCLYIVLPDMPLTQARLDAAMDGLTERYVSVSMPKFTVAFNMDLKDALADMGMDRAFTASAELGSMLKNYNGEPLQLTSVIHDTKIIVDEAGTEAAAATVVTGAGGGASYEPPGVYRGPALCFPDLQP